MLLIVALSNKQHIIRGLEWTVLLSHQLARPQQIKELVGLVELHLENVLDCILFGAMKNNFNSQLFLKFREVILEM